MTPEFDLCKSDGGVQSRRSLSALTLVTSYAVTAKVIPSSTKTSQDVLYERTVHACSEAAEF